MITQFSIRTFCQHLAQGYAWVLLMHSTRAGIVLIAAIFPSPQLGIISLLGASITLLTARGLRVTEELSSVYVFNWLLTGLFLATHYQINLSLLLLLVAVCVLAALITHSLASVMWRFSQLPVLSLPFVLVARLAQLAATGYGSLVPLADPSHLFISWLDTFLNSVASIFFQPNPYLSGVLFIMLLITSHTLAFLAVLGFCTGIAWHSVLTGNVAMYAAPSWIFNTMLAAMATGCLFVVPSGGSNQPMFSSYGLSSYRVTVFTINLAVFVWRTTHGKTRFGRYTHPTPRKILGRRSLGTHTLWLSCQCGIDSAVYGCVASVVRM